MSTRKQMEETRTRDQGADHTAEDVRSGIEDPRAKLSPTALRVLEAARQVIVEEGFEKLTLSRIGEVSGEKNVAAVKYYFGSKSGLISVVLDTVLYDSMSTLNAPSGDEFGGRGLTRLTVQTAVVNQPSDALTILFEMLPHVLRDAELVGRLRAYYEAFYQLHLAQVRREAGVLEAAPKGADERRPSPQGLASLLSALGDGLAIQAMVQPEHFDFLETLRALDVLLRHGLPLVERDEAR
jgi:AcrR family transcriptional regulator